MQVNLQTNQANYRRNQSNNDQVRFGLGFSKQVIEMINNNQTKIFEDRVLMNKFSKISEIGSDKVELVYECTEKSENKIQLFITQGRFKESVAEILGSSNSTIPDLFFAAIQKIDISDLSKKSQKITSNILNKTAQEIKDV